MRLIIGLGNPGAQYEQTRHNVGFRVVSTLASTNGWKWEKRGRAMIAIGSIDAEKIILVRPLTFMNNSGEALGELLRWYKVQPDEILVISDDLDLPTGKIRLRAQGSAGGHNGLSSIIQHLHTNQFPRLRVGIGRPSNPRMEIIDYVLGVPSTDERILLEAGEQRATEIIPLVVQEGIEFAMNVITTNTGGKRPKQELNS